MKNFLDLQTATPSLIDSCCVCKKKTSFFEINQKLGSKYQIIFRKPVEMLDEFVLKFKKSVSFQDFQRSRYLKHQSRHVGFFLKKCRLNLIIDF